MGKVGTPRPTNGGRRAGSGRKSGSATKRTREIADKLAAEQDVTPLEVMIGTMRELWSKAESFAKGEEGRAEAMVLACGVAEKAAPYIHPRLTSMKVEGDIRSQVTGLTDAELDEQLIELAARAGVAIAIGGTGEKTKH